MKKPNLPDPESPFVTVELTVSRESWEALLAKEDLIAQRYTPLGVVWSSLMAAIRTALGEPD